MCIVSDKIKFCTCINDDFEELPHYWLLFRFNKHKDLQYIGTTLMPLDFMQPNFKFNKATLLKRLNEPDAFDKEIEFKPKDQLKVVINNLLGYEERMEFGFKFKRGKWVAGECDSFELMNNYEQEAFGNFDKLEEK